MNSKAKLKYSQEPSTRLQRISYSKKRRFAFNFVKIQKKNIQ